MFNLARSRRRVVDDRTRFVVIRRLSGFCMSCHLKNKGTVEYAKASCRLRWMRSISILRKGAHGSMPEKGLTAFDRCQYLYFGFGHCGRETSLVARPFAQWESWWRHRLQCHSETARIEGSIRSFDLEGRNRIVNRIEVSARAFVTRWGSFEISGSLPPVYNNEALVDLSSRSRWYSAVKMFWLRNLSRL